LDTEAESKSFLSGINYVKYPRMTGSVIGKKLSILRGEWTMQLTIDN
jgi:hypothetical protein